MGDPDDHACNPGCNHDHSRVMDEIEAAAWLARFAAPGPPPPLSADDAARVDAVLRAVFRLRARNVRPLAQGLSAANAAGCLGVAASAITRDGLARELATPGRRPETVAVVCAHGVFTSPLEWVALFAAAGARVHLKAPSRDPAFCLALAQDFVAEGFVVIVSTERELPVAPPRTGGAFDAVVAMGDDASVQAVADATPGARHALHGHRFSVVLAGQPLAQVLAWEAAAYDTRGCMAPAALFYLGDARILADALAAELPAVEAAVPRGEVDPGLGPEWRRRLGLARVRGTVREGPGWAVAVLPVEHFVPVALPRFLTIHPVEGPEEVRAALHPWRHALSALSTDDALRPLHTAGWAEVYRWFPRVCPVGTLQRPPFPRLHDGVPMLGSVVLP